MFGFFKRRRKLDYPESVRRALLNTAAQIRTIEWDPRDASSQMALSTAIAALVATWNLHGRPTPIEDEGAFASILRGPVGSDGYSEEDRLYVFQQLKSCAGDEDATVVVMLYLMAPRYVTEHIQSFGG
jgi:hypothetical protein